MANLSFSLNRGQDAFAVIAGTDAPSTGDLEVSIDLTKFPAGVPLNNEIRMLLDHIENYLVGKSNVVQ